MYITRNGRTATALASYATLAMMLAAIGGCAKKDAAAPASGGDSASSAGSIASNTPASSGPATPMMPSDIMPVRGALVSVSDSALVVATLNGAVHVALDAPVHVYERANSDLSKVATKSFVGVTSVRQPDGSQVATEIHIFPEDLRGTGEGSYLMTQPGAKDSSRSTMTNGTVESAPKAGGPPRMTNGAVASKNGQTLTVDYHGGSQTINVPAGVSVTAIEPSTAKLEKGAKVVVLAKKQADGTMKASSVLLAAAPGGK